MSVMPSPHPPEFRRRAVELARQGDKPLVQLAKDFGISRSCLQNWVNQADAERWRQKRVRAADERREEGTCRAAAP
ncbi:helix-turn-helix domain-containing protein [Spirillospora sp. NPDC052242]